jgi:hypothetical protein
MINNQKAFLTGVAATMLLTATSAWAAEPQKPAPQTAQQTAVDKDVGKLSADGASALQDVRLTRIAIFEGRVDDAKKYVNLADSMLGKAKTDEAVFTKAEADLKPPAGKDARASTTVGAATQANKPTDNKSADNKPVDQLKKPIAWLPVDGALSINEDFSVNPTKKAAMADANKSLKSGDRNGAIEKLKLANMNVDVTMIVVPLEQTINDVHQAAGLINDGKYYEASQMLRDVQDGERFDVTSVTAKPAGK